MSLSNKLEELLSGYLDNQLNSDELREVETALEDPQVQSHLKQLQSNRDSLKALAAQSRPNLGPDFAKLVMAQVAAAQSAKGTSESVSPTLAGSHKQAFDSRVIAALAAIAATLMLAVYFWQNNSSTSRPGSDEIVSNDTKSKSSTDSDNVASPPKATYEPTQLPETSSSNRLVSKDDVIISYLMTLDVELPKGQNSESAIVPLLQQFGIHLVRGARVNKEVEKALDDLRITQAPQDAPLTTEVYLISASLDSLDSILESIRADQAKYSKVRFGMAYELPNDPILDKLSADVRKEADALSSMLKQASSPIALGQAIANSVVENGDVKVDMQFAAPLVANDGVRPSPFDAIPEQGKLVSSSNRRTKNTLRQQNEADKDKGFILLFVRQAE